jgi:hypothetical protein
MPLSFYFDDGNRVEDVQFSELYPLLYRSQDYFYMEYFLRHYIDIGEETLFSQLLSHPDFSRQLSPRTVFDLITNEHGLNSDFDWVVRALKSTPAMEDVGSASCLLKFPSLSRGWEIGTMLNFAVRRGANRVIQEMLTIPRINLSTDGSLHAAYLNSFRNDITLHAARLFNF